MRPVTSTDELGKVSRSKIAATSPCGKQAYSSKKVAKQRAVFSSKMTGETIEAYKCKRGCHAWHLGHPPGTKVAA
jgi:hypothetical protein